MRNLLSALLLVTTLSVIAQLDTRHYIPPMYAREDPATGTGEDIYLILSTPQTDPFEVTITDGAGTALYTNVSISRSSPVTLALSNATGASKGNGTKFLVPASDLATILSDEGMILTANKAFFVNIRVDEGAQAASLTTKGSAGLGTEFRTGHVWNNTTNNGNVFNRKAHVISFMASEDDTEVTISDFGGVDFENIDEAAQPVSGEISVMLDAGQSYVLAAHLKNSNTANTNDVNGTRITSDKPITVNSGSWLGGNPIDGNLQGRDIGIDQIASLEETGFEYILVQGQGNGNESAIVIASIDGTQIFLNGSTTPAATLDGGDFHLFSSADFTANENMHISSNQPVYVYQNTNGSVSSNERQNGLNFIPPIVCLGGTDVDIADADFTDAFGGTINSAILIIGEKNVDVTITDEFGTVTTLTDADANDVTGNPNYVTYKETGYSGNITVASARPIRVALTIESGNVGAAGFFSGFTIAPVIESPVGYDAAACIPENVPVELTATGFDSYQWYRNNVRLNGETNPSIFVDAPGEYTARGTISGCESSEQSFELEVALCPADVGIAKNEVSVNNVTGNIFDVTYDLYLENFSPVNDADNLQVIENITAGLPTGAVANLQVAPQVISGSFSQGGLNASFDGSTVTQMLQYATETKIDPAETVVVRFVVRIYMSGASTPTYTNQVVFSTKDVGPNDGSSPDRQDFSTSGTDPDPNGNGDPTDTDENETTQTCLSNTAISYDASTYFTTGSDPIPSIVGFSGGDFSVSGSGLTINETTGEIDLSASIVGTYTISYSFGGLCPVTTNVTIELNPPAEPTVVAQTTNTFTPSVSGSAVVETGQTLTVTVQGQVFELGVDPELTIAGTTWTLALPAGVITTDGLYDVEAVIDDGVGGNATDTTNGELTIDTANPTVDIQGAPTAVNNTDPYTVTIEFSKDILGFDITDINVGNGSAANLTMVDSDTYTVEITPGGVGDISIDVPMGAVQDAAGNTSVAAPQAVTIYDDVPPATPVSDTQVTNDTSPVITGSTGTGVALASGESMIVTVNGATYAVTPDASGDWSLDLETAVPVSGALGTFTDGNSYEVVTQVTDAAGNSTSDATTNELTIDTAAPSIPTITSQTTNNASPVLSGTAEASSTVTVVVNGVTFETTADASGNWTIDTETATPTAGGPFTDLADGPYDIAVTSTDAGGNSNSDTTTNEITIDTAAPSIPTVTSQTTNDSSPVLSGTAEASSTVTVVVNGVTFETTADASGNWTIDTETATPTAGGPFTDLADGPYDVSVTSTDAGGNSTSDTTTNEITIDTIAPSIPTITSQATNDASPVLSGTAESGSTVTVVVNGVTFETTADASGNWTIDTETATPTAGGPFTDLVDGPYDIAVTSTDSGGNSTSDTTTNEITIDMAAPSIPTVTSQTTNDASPVLSGTAEAGSTVTVVVNGVTFETTADASGNWTIDTETATPTSGGPFTALADGPYDVSVTSTDAGGNSTSDTTTNELTVDTAAPSIPTITSQTTNDASPVLSGTAEASSTVTVVVNGVTFETTAVASGNWTIDTETATPTAGGPFTDLADGLYDIAVTSTDSGGNSTSDTTANELTVDTAAPSVPTITSQTTNDSSPVLSGTAETGSTVTVVVNGVTFEATADASGNWTIDTETATPTAGGPFTDLADGPYDIAVTSTDAGGNSNSDTTTNEITIDTIAPSIPTITSQTTNDASPVLSGTAESGSTVTVVVNGVTFETTADVSGNWTIDTEMATPTAGGPFTDLSDGPYDVSVTSTDSGGNSSSDTTTNELTIDTVAPSVPTVTTQTTNDASPVLSGTAESGSTVTVVVNGVTFETTADVSGNWTIDTETATPTTGGPFTDLSDGPYDVSVTSTDSGGNSSSDTTTNELTINTSNLAIPTIESQVTVDNTPVLTGTATPGSIVTVNVGGADFQVTADINGNWVINTETVTPTSGLFNPNVNGANEVIVTSRDALGNSATDASTQELTILSGDADGDGVQDIDEDVNGDGDPTNDDTDGDGTPDYIDSDDDGDGIPTGDEDVNGDGDPTNDDTDGDGIPDYIDSDDDGDGIPTGDEDVNGDGDPTNDDTDGDGIPDYIDSDDDGDGIPTGDEDVNGDGDPRNDDTDGDGTPDYIDSDDDGDGIPTGDEDVNGDGDPTNDDTDGDGIPDYIDSDDDGDGIPTGDEDVNGDDDPTNDNTDGDGIPDYIDSDDDGDGISTKDEDTNGDGNPVNDDCDSDGTPNFLDPDSCDVDGDGVLDLEEDVDGDGNPYNDDCDSDGIPDFKDADSCTDKVTPRKGFSPDGDGDNDFFYIEDIENYPNNTVQIFNRWGNRLFEVKGYDNQGKSWRGESSYGVIPGQKEVPEGTYFYLIDLGDGSEPVSGYVIIKR